MNPATAVEEADSGAPEEDERLEALYYEGRGEYVQMELHRNQVIVLLKLTMDEYERIGPIGPESDKYDVQIRALVDGAMVALARSEGVTTEEIRESLGEEGEPFGPQQASGDQED